MFFASHCKTKQSRRRRGRLCLRQAEFTLCPGLCGGFWPGFIVELGNCTSARTNHKKAAYCSILRLNNENRPGRSDVSSILHWGIGVVAKPDNVVT